MSDETNQSQPPDRPSSNEDATLRSPIRPRPALETDETEVRAKPPSRANLLARAMQPANAAPSPEKPPDDPQAALEALRRKMEMVANEFSLGKLNRAQFNAIYGRYSEQRAIIQRLIERDPENPAWKQAAAPGHTSFLRQHFEARLMFYLVYQHNIPTPLMMGGQQQPNMDQISMVLKSLWGMSNRPKAGLARKEMRDGQWLVLALGEYALTLAMFQLEPSAAQAGLVRDLHSDFERANRKSLSVGTRSLDRFVFPQRALAEKDLV